MLLGKPGLLLRPDVGLQERPAGDQEGRAGRGRRGHALLVGAELAAAQQTMLQEQVEVEGQHGERLQQQQQLLEQGLAVAQRHAQEAPGVVVGGDHVWGDQEEQKRISALIDWRGIRWIGDSNLPLAVRVDGVCVPCFGLTFAAFIICVLETARHHLDTKWVKTMVGWIDLLVNKMRKSFIHPTGDNK